MQTLIDRGHPPHAVERYTLRQVWWYLGAIGRGHERERLAHERQRDGAE